MAVLVGFAVPISNVGAVHALARQNGGKALREIARNPFIIATVLALLCNFLRIPIPTAIDTALSRLGACAIAIGLMCVRSTLPLQGARNAGMLMGRIITSEEDTSELKSLMRNSYAVFCLKNKMLLQ